MNAMFVKYAGPLTKLMISQTSSSAIRSDAIAGMTYVPAVRLARSGAVATLVAIRVLETHRGRQGLPRCNHRSVVTRQPIRLACGTSVLTGMRFFPDCL